MADNEPTISMAGINAPPLYRLVTCSSNAM